MSCSADFRACVADQVGKWDKALRVPFLGHMVLELFDLRQDGACHEGPPSANHVASVTADLKFTRMLLDCPNLEWHSVGGVYLLRNRRKNNKLAKR